MTLKSPMVIIDEAHHFRSSDLREPLTDLAAMAQMI
jgi:hypothetical protein